MKGIMSYALIVLGAVLCFGISPSWSQVEGIDGTWYCGEKPLTTKFMTVAGDLVSLTRQDENQMEKLSTRV